MNLLRVAYYEKILLLNTATCWGDYRIDGPMKKMLNIARYFDHPTEETKPDLGVRLPRQDAQISQDRTLFQKIYDWLGLSSSRDQYMQQRAQQVEFVRTESQAERLVRLELEKQNLLAVTHRLDQFSNYLRETANAWLPSFVTQTWADYLSGDKPMPEGLQLRMRV